MFRTGVFVAGMVLAGAFVGWHFYAFEAAFSLLLLFALIALPLLFLSFFLAITEAEIERHLVLAESRSSEVVASIRQAAQTGRQLLFHSRHAA